MRLFTIGLIVSLISNIAVADGDAIFLEQGKTAPFTGYLITQDKANKIRLMDIDLQIANKLNTGLQSENDILRQRLDNSQQQIDILSKRVIEAKDDSFFSKAGYFILGSLITGLIGYGVYRSSK